MKIYEFEGKQPKISPDVSFIDDSVVIIGDVSIGEGCTIFANVVIEGHPNRVIIGSKCNIQSGTVIHGLEDSDTILGSHCTIGHRSILHGCNLENNVTVGMGSIVMGYTKIGEGSVIGAGSLVTEKKVFEKNSLIIGSPAAVKKEITEEAVAKAIEIAELYSKEGKNLSKGLKLIE